LVKPTIRTLIDSFCGNWQYVKSCYLVAAAYLHDIGYAPEKLDEALKKKQGDDKKESS
jgi:predicted HD phosphohydrolase